MILDGRKKRFASRKLLNQQLGGIPSALVLILAAFTPQSLAKVSSVEVTVALGGLALLYVSLKEALR